MRISDWSSDVCSSDLRGRRAEAFRLFKLAVDDVDGENLARAGDPRALDDRGADAAATEYRDARPGFDLRGVERRTDAGQDRAPDERGAIERNILVDRKSTRLNSSH